MKINRNASKMTLIKNKHKDLIVPFQLVVTGSTLASLLSWRANLVVVAFPLGFSGLHLNLGTVTVVDEGVIPFVIAPLNALAFSIDSFYRADRSIILTVHLRILTWKCDIIERPARNTLLKTSKLSNDN